MKGTTTETLIIGELRSLGILDSQDYDETLHLDFKDEDFVGLDMPAKSFCIRECHFMGQTRFTNLNLNHSKIVFENCHFDQTFKFENISVSSVLFKNCSFYQDSFFRNITLSNQRFSIFDCKFIESAAFFKIKCDFILLKDNAFQTCFFGEIDTKTLRLSILKSNIYAKELFFNNINPNLQLVEIESRQRINLLHLFDFQRIVLKSDISEIKIESENFKSLVVDGNQNAEKLIGKVDRVNFMKRNFSGSISFSNYEIENLLFVDLSSTNGIISFNNVKIQHANFENVNISKIYWNLVEFLGILTIKNSDLSGLKPNNVKWLKNQVISPDHTTNSIPLFYRFKKNKKFVNEQLVTELKHQRDSYRQLKVASQNNHNQTEALAFYRNEMRLYWKEIRLVGGISRSNRFLVFLNRSMSDFGQNYWLPLMWILIFQTIFSTLIWNFEACENCGIGTNCENDSWKGLSEYLTWINPIFKAPEDWSSGAKITSFFMRIFNGFFIYHFIKAIRKYGKGE